MTDGLERKMNWHHLRGLQSDCVCCVLLETNFQTCWPSFIAELLSEHSWLGFRGHHYHNLEEAIEFNDETRFEASSQKFVFHAAGSKDGSVKLWRCGVGFKSLEPLFTIPAVSFLVLFCACQPHEGAHQL